MFTPVPAAFPDNRSPQFDLWSAGGNDFPSPNKVPKVRQENPVKTMFFIHSYFLLMYRSKSTSTPGLPRPVSRGPTFVNNSPIKAVSRKRHSGGDEGEGIPGIRRF